MKRYYTDGSSTIGVKSAFVVVNEHGCILEFMRTPAPGYTNNEEEYRGVIAALRRCSEGDEVYTDSLLVVNQVHGLYKVKKPELKPYCETVKQLLADKKAELMYIPREENLAGKVFEK
jgi:ribonuclease HI